MKKIEPFYNLFIYNVYYLQIYNIWILFTKIKAT